MKQYKWKPWEGALDSPSDDDSPNLSKLSHEPEEPEPEESESMEPKEPRDVSKMEKLDLVNAMEWEHPTRTLEIGTLNGNLNRVWQQDPGVGSRIKACLAEVVSLASHTKRTCQKAIGQYIEHLFDAGGIIDEMDRAILDCICPRIPSDGGKKSKDLQSNFISSLLTCVYSKNLPCDKGIGRHVRTFVTRAKDFLPAMHKASELRTKMDYPGSTILRSTATQLSTELKKHYVAGSQALCDKVCVQQIKCVFFWKGVSVNIRY
jgi:hypothetical protein